MRVAGEILLWVVGIGILFTVSRGIGPASGVLRVLLSPPGIIGVIVLVLLWRWRFSTRSANEETT